MPADPAPWPVPDGTQTVDLSGMVAAATGAAPMFGIALTLITYAISVRLHGWMGRPALLHPLLIAIVLLAGVLTAVGLPYERFYETAEPLHLLLGPVVVLLAVPLWRQLDAIRSLGACLIPVLLVGAATGIATSAGLAYLLEAPAEVTATLAPKSVTTPVAIGLAETLGGIPAITALVVILTGLAGASLGAPMLNSLGLSDPRVQGLAFGIGSHVIGTARAFQISEVTGAFSSLGMIMNALVTALLLALFTLAVA